MTNIFDYIDYREYLRDVFAEKKKSIPCFSHRYMCGKLNLSTSNHILLIIQGKRNLTESVTNRLASFLALSEAEKEYLEYLTLYQSTKNKKIKDMCMEKMTKARISGQQSKTDGTKPAYLIFEQVRLKQENKVLVCARLHTKNNE
jgi:uncharacterized protein (TIGR02147 family)